MIELLTGILVAVTAFYSWATYKILRANESVLREMEMQREDTYRPYISIFPSTYSDSSIIYLEIVNTGKTAAHNLTLELNKDFYQFGRIEAPGNMRFLSAFSENIDCFSPQSKMIFYLATGDDLFGPGFDENKTPKKFSIKSTYSYSEKMVEEVTNIDLTPYNNTAIPPNPIVSTLKNMTKSIERIKVT